MDKVLKKAAVAQLAQEIFVTLCQPHIEHDAEGNAMQGIFFPNPPGCFQAAEVMIRAMEDYCAQTEKEESEDDNKCS